MTMRTLVVHRHFDRPRGELDFLGALAEVADLAEWTPGIQFDDYDAVVFMVAFRDLVSAQPIPWRGFDGVRAMLDHDSLQNYWAVSERAPYLGAWPPTFRRHAFDLLICSGGHLAERFTEDGVPSVWIPKGFSPERFFDADRDRHGFAHFGSPRRARAVMLSRVARAGVAVDHLQVPYPELSDRLNDYLACLVCNGAGRVPLGKLGRAINRVHPFVKVGASVEPMMKNFEAAAAGCAVFADQHPDFADLGFVDGETMVGYSDFDELIEKLRHYRADPAALRRIGRSAAAQALERHTWAHRAEQLHAVLRSVAGSG